MQNSKRYNISAIVSNHCRCRSEISEWTSTEPMTSISMPRHQLSHVLRLLGALRRLRCLLHRLRRGWCRIASRLRVRGHRRRVLARLGHVLSQLLVRRRRGSKLQGAVVKLELCRFRFLKNRDYNSFAVFSDLSGIGTGIVMEKGIGKGFTIPYFTDRKKFTITYLEVYRHSSSGDVALITV